VKPLAINWTKHLSDPQRKQDFEGTLRNNTLVFDRLKAIIQEWDTAILDMQTTKAQYASPAWSHLQAHLNGSREMLKKMKDLIDFY
jgi:hypothetical protein